MSTPNPYNSKKIRKPSIPWEKYASQVHGKKFIFLQIFYVKLKIHTQMEQSRQAKLFSRESMTPKQAKLYNHLIKYTQILRQFSVRMAAHCWPLDKALLERQVGQGPSEYKKKEKASQEIYFLTPWAKNPQCDHGSKRL